MTSIFDRLASAFLAPPGAEVGARHERGRAAAERGRSAPERAGSAPERGGSAPERGRSAPTVAILCRPDGAWALGGAAALLLAARHRSSYSALLVWGGVDAPALRPPASSGARRLADRLTGCGHDATATGRLAVVRLDGKLSVVAAEAVRVLDAIDVPAAVVFAGPRDDGADVLLRAQDAVLVAAGDDQVVAELAVDGLAGIGVRARTLGVPAEMSAAARALAAAGVVVLPPLRAALGELP